MRKLKFRMWNPTEREMYDLGLESLGNGFYQENRDELMMYTGLKDSKGVEIYEGDIFREDYPAGDSIYEVCFGHYDNGMDYEDGFRGIGFYLKEHAHSPNYELRIVELFAGEVIGNIYENPELVNK